MQVDDFSLNIPSSICKKHNGDFVRFFCSVYDSSSGLHSISTRLQRNVFPFNECKEVNIYTKTAQCALFWQCVFYFEGQTELFLAVIQTFFLLSHNKVCDVCTPGWRAQASQPPGFSLFRIKIIPWQLSDESRQTSWSTARGTRASTPSNTFTAHRKISWRTKEWKKARRTESETCLCFYCFYF